MFPLPQIVRDPILALHGIPPRIRLMSPFRQPEGRVSLPRPSPIWDLRTQPQPEGRVARPQPMQPRDLPARDSRIVTLHRLRTYIPEGVGLSDGEAGFWNSITSSLTGAISSAIPALAQVQVAKLQAQSTASLLKSQSQLYTPQNIATLQAQGQFEATQRANLAAAASGSTMAPMSTGTLIALGAVALGGIWLLTRKK